MEGELPELQGTQNVLFKLDMRIHICICDSDKERVRACASVCDQS